MAPIPEDYWEAWSPKQLAERLRGVPCEWYVVGGWALDLWQGHQSRPHDDLEFAVRPEHALTVVHHLGDLAFYAAHAGGLAEAAVGHRLPQDVWQFWGSDLAEGCWRVDMMIERGTPEAWSYKRAPDITVSRSSAIRIGAGGICYLAPHLVLLFKARHCRPKDDADFERAVPLLSASDRADLRSLLLRLHPDHKWIEAL